MAQVQQLQFKITKGMNQDIDVQSSVPNQAFKLFNIKNQSIDSSTYGDLTNEKGNSIMKDSIGDNLYISGTVLGIIQCTDNIVILFTYESPTVNTIYKITYLSNTDRLNAKTIAQGNFNIPKDAEISGLFVYENSELQKIYWVDGYNQLRYINIADTNPLIQGTNKITDANFLNSKPSFKLDHNLTVERISGGGAFTSGVIQYAFTYFTKYGAETNIVDISPLYYISEDTRGCAADEVVGCSFKVSIQNPDSNFDYIRLYSIQRSSLNGTPIVKIVNDIKIQ